MPRTFIRRLGELFQRADDRYNSGLFHFSPEKERPEPPDELTLSLSIDDKPLKELLQNLYFPESPYEFSVFPAEILGQVYEQFLGKVIRLTEGHRAKVEEKPEVRKAGGVYYTPSYIVDYIVQNTVARSCGKKARPGGRHAVLDPACGSGSFLLALSISGMASRWYVQNDPEKHARRRAPNLPRRGGRLAAHDRRKETDSAEQHLRRGHRPAGSRGNEALAVVKGARGRVGRNVPTSCGFSTSGHCPTCRQYQVRQFTVGPDYYNGRQMSLLDDDERWRINVFDWKTGFRKSFAAEIRLPRCDRQSALCAVAGCFSRR